MADIPILGKLKSATTEVVLADAEEIAVPGGSSVGAVLPTVLGGDGSVVPATLLTQAEYDALVDVGTVEASRLYLIYEEDESG